MDLGALPTSINPLKCDKTSLFTRCLLHTWQTFHSSFCFSRGKLVQGQSQADMSTSEDMQIYPQFPPVDRPASHIRSNPLSKFFLLDWMSLLLTLTEQEE